MQISSQSLVNILIAKSLAETVLVGAIAVWFFATAFPPYFHGWGEARNHSIKGWVVNDAVPLDRVEVQLFIDEEFMGTALANAPRPDVLAAKWSKDEWHGYQFEVPNLRPGEHEARVYAMHASGGGIRRTLQLIGDPIRFRRNDDGTLTDLSQNAGK